MFLRASWDCVPAAKKWAGGPWIPVAEISFPPDAGAEREFQEPRVANKKGYEEMANLHNKWKPVKFSRYVLRYTRTATYSNFNTTCSILLSYSTCSLTCMLTKQVSLELVRLFASKYGTNNPAPKSFLYHTASDFMTLIWEFITGPTALKIRRRSCFITRSMKSFQTPAPTAVKSFIVLVSWLCHQLKHVGSSGLLSSLRGEKSTAS